VVLQIGCLVDEEFSYIALHATPPVSEAALNLMNKRFARVPRDDFLRFECLRVSSHIYLHEFVEDAKRMPVNCHRVAG
jgi:hypothetical protein